MTLPQYLARFWHLQRAAIITGLGAAVLTAVAVFMMPSTYTTSGIVTVSAGQTERLSGSLLSLAQRFGLGGAQATFGPDYVAAVMRSSEVLGRVARVPFPRETYATLEPRGCAPDAPTCDLVSILGVGRRTSADSLEQAVRSLRDVVSTDVGSRQGLVTLTAKAKSPPLAAAIAKAIIAQTDTLNQQLQREAGRQQRAFAEERLRIATDELAENERALQNFDAANRDVSGSPALRTRRAQLDRAVRLSETVYIQLRSAVEDAMLAEANDISTISVVQEPAVPARHSWPKRRLLIALAFMLGVLGWSAWQYAREVGGFVRVLLRPPRGVDTA